LSAPGPPPAAPLLPARSVLLSILLGSHPPRLPVRSLVHTAGLFGIAEGTARVALSRLSATWPVSGIRMPPCGRRGGRGTGAGSC
jgi:DNA-binding transcriptional regulator PaaX